MNSAAGHVPETSTRRVRFDETRRVVFVTGTKRYVRLVFSQFSHRILCMCAGGVHTSALIIHGSPRQHTSIKVAWLAQDGRTHVKMALVTGPATALSVPTYKSAHGSPGFF